MVTDIVSVMWKELREMVFPDGRFQGGARNVIILIGIAGILFPLQYGRDWFTSWLAVYSACFPVILVLNYTIDSFAGERERHTLETLLASRLDDRAIILGKVLAIVLYGWVLVMLCQPLAVVTVNVANRGGGFLFYRPAILLAIAVMSFLVAALLCSVGVLVSMTAPTVRSAGQRMLVPFVLMVLTPSAIPYLVRWLHWEEEASRLTAGAVVVMMAVAFAIVIGITLWLGVRRFVRERLVLA